MKALSILACMLVCYYFSAAQNVVQLEYFIDNDAGFRNNKLITLTASGDSSWSFTASLTGIEPGYHILGMRTKDSNGKWSQTIRKQIEVLPTAAKQVMTSGEYFIDTDPGFGSATAFAFTPQDSVVTQAININTAALLPGYHILYLRTKDNYGRWGMTTRQHIEIVRSNTTTNITAVEYAFVTDPGVGNANSIAFNPVSPDSTFAFTIPKNKIPVGNSTLYLRVRSSDGKWSFTQSKAATRTAYEFIGSGNWSTASNWRNNQIPPATLTNGADVIINPSGTNECIVDVANQTISSGTSITVYAGKKIRIVNKFNLLTGGKFELQ